MNKLHEEIINDETVVERPTPDWVKLEKSTREYLEVVGKIEKALDQVKKDMDQAFTLLPKMYHLAPQTDSLFNDSPLRPTALRLAIKQHMKRAGFDFISTGQPTLADVKLKSLTENAKEVTKWLFKLKPKE